jgi:hypothetical protein
VPNGGLNRFDSLESKDAQSQIVKGGKILRRMAFSCPTFVFAHHDVANPVQLVLDPPMSAIEFQ